MDLTFKSSRRDLLKFLAVATPIGAMAVEKSKEKEIEGKIQLADSIPVLHKETWLRPYCYVHEATITPNAPFVGKGLMVNINGITAMPVFPLIPTVIGDKPFRFTFLFVGETIVK